MRSVIRVALWYGLILCVPTIVYAKDIQITATPIAVFLPEKPKQMHFGKLEFLGGLALTSRNDDFGGISGLRLDAEGNNLFAVTDKGHFLKASLKRDIFGKIIALENAEISRLRNSKGKKLKGKKNTDAESLEVSGSQFLVGFERNHRIAFFNLEHGKLKGDKRAELLDFRAFKFPNNKGLEAIAISPASGELLVFAEYAPDKNDNHQGFIVRNNDIHPLGITLTAGYSLTDADYLPNGDLLILERSYKLITGRTIRIRQFDADNLKPGAVISGRTIMEASSRMEIDNMEGLAITQKPDGSILLTLISDDNFAWNQRTLLLEFKLIQ